MHGRCERVQRSYNWKDKDKAAISKTGGEVKGTKGGGAHKCDASNYEEALHPEEEALSEHS